MSFDSYNPNNHKESVVRTLLHRANTICDVKTGKFIKVKRKIFNDTGNDNSISTPKLKYCVAPYIKNGANVSREFLNNSIFT